MHGDEGSLAQSLIDLAALPDDAPDLGAHLKRVAEGVAVRVPAVDYTSVTTHEDGGYATVAMTSELALAVDEAQYDAGAGPCIDAASGAVIAVADAATVIEWPNFREAAVKLGLRSSLSIPLFTASGAARIALNLYAHRPAALMPLAVAVEAEMQARPRGTPASPLWDTALDEGSCELVRGLSDALQVRDLIQRAVGILMQRDHVDARDGYIALRLDAITAGRSVLEQAATVTETGEQTREAGEGMS
jgi:hypothetical protein